LTSPPDKLCSNSRSLRYANSHHIPDGTRRQIDKAQSGSALAGDALLCHVALRVYLRLSWIKLFNLT